MGGRTRGDANRCECELSECLCNGELTVSILPVMYLTLLSLRTMSVAYPWVLVV